MVPCLTIDALKLFVGTADERYGISPQYFRDTHHPQVLHRYFNYQLIQEVTEGELLDELKQDVVFRNRMYVIFGSTGSGKSELLCWLKDQWAVQEIPRPVIRISRSELNPQVLITKCYQSLGIEMDITLDDSRWNILLQKPIAIVNQMIWSTLAEFLETDDQIVPLALLLRPVIEKNIVAFSEQVRKGNLSQPLQLLSHEQFSRLISGTSLQLDVAYESLHQSLIRKLDHFLFHGQDLVSMFKQLSERMIEKQVRPLLLIDDLVQSVNLYAAELLDHLVNLEEGNWDVVIGLTPGTLRDSEKGSVLLHRIMNLDTIDDRVRKLWLTDDAGHEFYTLDREHAVDYMERYLVELKKTQGFICSSACKHATQCSQYLVGQDARLSLLPFNSSLVERMYDAIPSGKGKLRYMILHAKEILLFFKNGTEQGIEKVRAYVNRDCFVDHPNKRIKTLGEWYASPFMDEVVLPSALLKEIGCGEESLTLRPRNVTRSSINAVPTVPDMRTLEQSVIRDWIEGEEVNTELLEPVRLGVASFVHDVLKATSVIRPYTPRVNATFQRVEVTNRTRYPIMFAPHQERTEGIIIEKNLSAFEIADFQQLNHKGRTDLFQSLAHEKDIAEWVYQGELIREGWRREVSEAIGSPLPEFAFHFRQWVQLWYEIANQRWLDGIRHPFHQSTLRLAEELYGDWYLLRDNMVDADLYDSMNGETKFVEKFLTGEFPSVLEKYDLGSSSALDYLVKLRDDYRSFEEQMLRVFDQKISKLTEMLPFLRRVSPALSDRVHVLIGLRGEEHTCCDRIAATMMNIDRWCLEEDVYERWDSENKKNAFYQILHPRLRQDLGISDKSSTRDELIGELDRDIRIRPRVRQQIKNLMVHGQSLLPASQWHGILNDLRTDCPSFFSALRLRIEITRE